MFKLLVVITVIVGAAAAVPIQNISRQAELEAEIFFNGEGIRPELMKTKVDELEAIYKEQDKEGTIRDTMSKWMRSTVSLMAVIGNPNSVNCQEMIPYNRLVDMLIHFHNIHASSGIFLSYYQQKQREICAMYQQS